MKKIKRLGPTKDIKPTESTKTKEDYKADFMRSIEDFRKLIKAKSIVYEDHGKGETYTIDMGKVIAKLDVGGTPYDGGYMNISISKHQGE